MATPLELLKSAPISGTYPERWFDATGECTWVVFRPPEDDPWVGVFGNGGATRYTEAFLSSDGKTAYVFACGQGYAVSFPSGELLFRTDCDYLTAALVVPNSPYVLACDFTELHVYSAAGEVWTSDQVALDGIRLLSADSLGAEAAVWQPDGWYELAVSFDPFLAEQRALLTKDWYAYSTM